MISIKDKVSLVGASVGVACGIFFISLSHYSEIVLPAVLRPGLVLTAPISIGGWLFIWGDNGPPNEWLDGKFINYLTGLCLYAIIGMGIAHLVVHICQAGLRKNMRMIGVVLGLIFWFQMTIYPHNVTKFGSPVNEIFLLLSKPIYFFTSLFADKYAVTTIWARSSLVNALAGLLLCCFLGGAAGHIFGKLWRTK